MRFAAARNVAKAWLLLIGVSGVLALVGWAIGGVRLLSIFVFAACCSSVGAYWTFDRVVLGMVHARELPIAEAPLLHSTVERLAARAGVLKPKLYLIPNGLPLALATGRGPTYSAIALSSRLPQRVPAGGARRRDRARARAREASRRRAADGRRRARRVDDRAEPHRRLPLSARCSSCSGRSPPPACTC